MKFNPPQMERGEFMSIVTLFFMKKKKILLKLSQCGAISEKTAVTTEEAGLIEFFYLKEALNILEKENKIIKTKDNKYYLNK